MDGQLLKIYAMNVNDLNLSDEYHLWFLTKKMPEVLSEERLSHQKKLSLGAEALLNRALEAAAPEIPRPAGYVRNDHGKPYLHPWCGIYVNWSHSGSYVLCAVSDREVGVDLQETVREPKESLVRRVLQPEERAFYERQEKERQKALFYEYWVLKESFLKALGTGFGTSLDRFYVKMEGKAPAIVQSVNEKNYHCRLLNFSDPAYKAAVCWEGPDGPDQLEIEYF